jgi:transposase
LASLYGFQEKNQFFTLNDLLSYARTELEFSKSRSTLHKILKSMGFRYKKCNGRRILCEQPYVKAQKLSFLKKYMQYSEDESVVFIFLEGT